MNDVIIRNAVLSEIDGILDVEYEKWRSEIAAGKEKWESRIRIFPEGTKVAIKKNKIVGVVVAHIIKADYSNGNFLSWSEATADGFITNHDPNGNILYGVNMSVSVNNPNVAKMLLQEILEISKKRKLTAILGGRIPTLHKFGKNKNDFCEKDVIMYAEKDPLINFFKSAGFSVIGAMKDYMPGDEESFEWGAILEIKVK